MHSADKINYLSMPHFFIEYIHQKKISYTVSYNKYCRPNDVMQVIGHIFVIIISNSKLNYIFLNVSPLTVQRHKNKNLEILLVIEQKKKLNVQRERSGADIRSEFFKTFSD